MWVAFQRAVKITTCKVSCVRRDKLISCRQESIFCSAVIFLTLISAAFSDRFLPTIMFPVLQYSVSYEGGFQFIVHLKVLGSFSNDDGDTEDDAL